MAAETEPLSDFQRQTLSRVMHESLGQPRPGHHHRPHRRHVGKSYQNLCGWLGGSFIDVADARVGLNPFPRGGEHHRAVAVLQAEDHGVEVGRPAGEAGQPLVQRRVDLVGGPGAAGGEAGFGPVRVGIVHAGGDDEGCPQAAIAFGQVADQPAGDPELDAGREDLDAEHGEAGGTQPQPVAVDAEVEVGIDRLLGQEQVAMRLDRLAVAPGGVRAARQAQIEQVEDRGRGQPARSQLEVLERLPAAPQVALGGGELVFFRRRPGERQLDGDHQLEVADQGVGLGMRPVDRSQQMLGALGDRLLEQRIAVAAAQLDHLTDLLAHGRAGDQVEAQERPGRPLQRQERAQALLRAVVTAGQWPAGKAEGDALVVAQEQVPVRLVCHQAQQAADPVPGGAGRHDGLLAASHAARSWGRPSLEVPSARTIQGTAFTPSIWAVITRRCTASMLQAGVCAMPASSR